MNIGTSYYDDSFFGATASVGYTGGAAGMNAYQNLPGNVVLYWAYEPIGITFDSMEWLVETDLVDTFDSSELKAYATTDQLLTVTGSFAAGNTFSGIFDGITVAVGFTGSHSDTLIAIAAGISGATCGSEVEDGSIVVRSIDPTQGVTITGLTGGATGPAIVSSLRISYIDGCVHKGVVVPIYDRLQSVDEPMYWRVRGVTGSVASEWSESVGATGNTGNLGGVFDIPKAVDEETRVSLLSFLPDVLYDKSSTSNVYKLHNAMAKEFDNVSQELALVNSDLYIKSVRDSSIDSNFGDLLGISRPYGLELIDYREILRTFMENIRKAPAQLAIKNMVFAVYRHEPDFINIRDEFSEYITDPGVTGPDYPTGIPSSFVGATGATGPGAPTGISSIYVWDNQNLAFGVIIEVTDDLSCAIITKAYVESILKNMVPAHCPFYIRLV